VAAILILKRQTISWNFLNIMPLEDVPDLHLSVSAIGKENIADARNFDEGMTSAPCTLGS
jgi:hypothetical protein